MTRLFMIRKTAVVGLLAAALAVSSTVRGDTSSVNSLRVEKGSGSASFIISKMGAIDVQDFMMEDPPRLVLDFLGAKHDLAGNKFDGDGDFVRRVRSSQFSFDPDQVTRIVFDLEENVSYEVSNLSQSVTVRFFKKDGAAEAAAKPKTMDSSVAPIGMADAARTIQPLPPKNTVEAADKDAGNAGDKGSTLWSQLTKNDADEQPATKPATTTSWTRPESGTDAAGTDTKSTSAASDDTKAKSEPADQEPPRPAMPSWMKPSSTAKTPASGTTPRSSRQNPPQMKTQGARAFQTGMVRNRNMTIDVQNASIKTVLRSVAEFSNTNIISGPEVEGKVTAHLKNVPWRQALDIILKSHGFGWREEYGVIRVSTIDKLTKEELSLQVAARKKDDLLPLHTRIMPLSFAKAGEIKKALKEILTGRGSIAIETGRNVLIVNDIEKVLNKIESMVTELDRRTRQVEIVAKMVDVDYEASQEMGIRWDALNLTAGEAFGSGIIDARSAGPVGTFRVGTIQSWGSIEALVDLLAQENRANIISNPRIVTTDNREATILVGKEIPLIVSDEAGNPITELTKVGIILRVTPHVNKDNSITLDLHPEVSELSSQATVQGGVIISLSEADTRLVVANGETAVMGGLISEVESSLERGIPILKDIPLIGNFFKLRSTIKKKRELIIFVTPTIVESGTEVGMGSGQEFDTGFDE
ncbi:MAG: type IV pilus secretin PilQ [Candidatus Krumholzibacteria bacterium]